MYNDEKISIEEFREDAIYWADSYGKGSQEGIKYCLNMAQDNFGLVDGYTQELIADAFGVDQKTVKALIKFMPNVKEEIVACEIVCCSGPRCSKNRSMEVLKAAKATLGVEFGETTSNGRIKLLTQNCFKKCGQGPNIRVNGKFYHEMNKAKTEQLMKALLEQYK